MCDELIKRTCRTCLITEEVELLDWSDEGFIEGFNYAQCFQECTQLELSLELPQMLCYDCAFELRITHSFIKRARKADQKLRSYIQAELDKRVLQEKASVMSPTVEMDERSKSSPALLGHDMLDLMRKMAEDALVDVSNDPSQEMFANSTNLEQSYESTTHDSITHLESHESDLVLRHSAEQNLPYEKVHQNQSTEYNTEKSIDIQNEDVHVNVLLSCVLTEDATTAENKIDSDSGKKFIMAKIIDDWKVLLELPENNSQAPGTEKKEEKCTCKICGFAFTTKYSLRRHFVTHEKVRQKAENIHQCEVCKEIFDTKSKLTIHMDITHKDRKWLCHICSRFFKSEIGLRKHEATHEKRERKYSCDMCGIKCLSKENLRGHMKVHEKNRKPTFACDECEKTFFVRSGLVLHKRLHSGDTINCEICQRGFPRAVDLKVHMRSHSNEKPYKCEFCESTFKTKAAHNYHALKHKVLQIQCNMCEKVLADVRSLQKHRKDHDGASHKCQVCGKAFYTKYKTLRHIRAVHSISSSEEAEKLVVCFKREKVLRPRLNVFFS